MATSKSKAQPAAKGGTATKPAPAAVEKFTPKSGGVAVPESMAALYAAHAGAGLENATVSDFALPFIYLLQSNSPAVDEGGDAYVEGARPGKFMNTVTQEIYDSIRAIPVEFDKVYNEWVPRDDGGGFVASHRSRAEAEAAKREDTQIVDTANHYVLVEGADGEWMPAIISLTSTKLKASRNWLSKISQVLVPGPNGKRVVAPSFSKIYTIEPVRAENDKGKFYTIKVSPVEGEEGWVQDIALFEMALGFAEQVKAGQKGADYSRQEGVTDAVVEEIDEDEETTGRGQ